MRRVSMLTIFACLCCITFIISSVSAVAREYWPALPENPSDCRHQRDIDAPSIPCLIGQINLEDVLFYVRDRWQPDTFVKFSPNGRLLGIGSYTGILRLWDVYGQKILWEKHIAEGIVKRIDFSNNGDRVCFGEQSVDGFIYCAKTNTGDVQWRFRLADDLQTSPPPAKDDSYGIFSLPAPYGLKVLDNGDVLVLGIHSWNDEKTFRDRTMLSRIYRLSPEGKVRWVYPKEAPLPMTVIYMDSDSRGDNIAFLITKKGAQPDIVTPYAEGTMVVLDGRAGKPVWQYTFEPLSPFFDSVGFWESISVAPDGARASVGLFDGRTMLFDIAHKRVENVFDFGAPISISGVPVSASATYNHLASDGMAYFQTGTSSVPMASTMAHVVAPPGPHPNATMLTAVGPDGKIKWRYRSGHSFQNFWSSTDGRWLLTSVLRDNDQLGWESGAMLFDTHRNGGGTSKLVYFYQVEGKTHFHADISSDGAAFALVETPYRDPQTERIVGSYQVHVVR
jgi:outer membrane protein assembly factor BamB